MIARNMYRHYADVTTLELHYPGLRALLEYFISTVNPASGLVETPGYGARVVAIFFVGRTELAWCTWLHGRRGLGGRDGTRLPARGAHAFRLRVGFLLRAGTGIHG